MKTDSLELMPSAAPMPVATQAPSSLSILDAAVRGGINKDNVEVVERLVALRRDELKEQAKAAFAKAFVELRRNMPEIYADKQAMDNSGRVAYVYASEEEISKKIEPILLSYGFCMLPGQRQENGLVTVIITLIHEQGHQEVREYTVHPGASNRMKDATAVDTGATTSAWRHLVIKMFGLKSRIREEDDPRNIGDGPITKDQADELERRVALSESNVQAFLKFAGAKSFAEIPASKYEMLDAGLRKKEQQGR